MAQDIPAYRSSRLPGGESDINMLMYIDSYHDFKGMRGKIGERSCVPFIDAYMIKNGIVSAGGKPPRNAVLDFFAGKNIQYSKIEQSSRLYFEKTYPKTLYGTPEYGTTPTVVTYTDILKIANLRGDALRLELDSVFQTSINKSAAISDLYKSVGNAFLDWMFPGSAMNTEVGISIDAKAALIDDLLLPLSDRRAKFYATHVVTPQNILDSARTSFGILPGILNDNSSRIIYTNDLANEYANILTQNEGRFQIVKAADYDTNRYGFQWQFVPTGGAPITIPVSQTKSSGPSVNFLANMALSCNSLEKGNKRAVCLTKIANIAKNATMADPTPVLQTFSSEDFIKMCIDIKRLGDHEQANAVFMRNNTAKCMFVTGDTLSGLYSRILGNPTIYASTPAGSEDEEGDVGSSSALLCYRGLPKSVSPEQEATRRLEYALDSVNYVLTVYSQLASLAEGSSFALLKENIKTHVDTYQYIDAGLPPDISTLYNLLIRWRVYDILAHIEDIEALFASSKEGIMAKLREFEGAIQGFKGERIDCTTNGANIVLRPGDIERIQSASNKIEAELAKFRAKTEEANTYIKYFNNAKTFDADGNTIFTFKYELYFSDIKIAPSLAFLQFYMADIEAIISQIIRLKAGKVLRSSTDDQLRAALAACAYSFVSKFYKTTDIVGELDILLPITKILNDTSRFTDKPTVDRLIQSLSAIIHQNVESLKGYISRKRVGPYVGQATAAVGIMRTAEVGAEAVSSKAPNNIGRAAIMRAATKAHNAANSAIEAALPVMDAQRSSRLSSADPSYSTGGAGAMTMTMPYANRTGLQLQRNTRNSLRTRKNYKNRATPTNMPDMYPIFAGVIDLAIDLLTTYSDMFEIVTGDKAIYTQEKEERGKTEIQQGGEIVTAGPGKYASNYGFHTQFYSVVHALIESKELCKEYRDPIGGVKEARASLNAAVDTADISSNQLDILATDEHNKRIFDSIGKIWFALDALFTLRGPPDFSIEPAYSKTIYNDIRLHSAYQTLLRLFAGEYDAAKFGIFRANMRDIALYTDSKNTITIDTLIDSLPVSILPRVITGLAVTEENVKTVRNQVVAAKLDKIDYYISEAREDLSVLTSVSSDNAAVRQTLAYRLRQIEELIADVYAIDATNTYVDVVSTWLARLPGASGTVSSIVYSDYAAAKVYYGQLHNEGKYRAMATLYNDAISLAKRGGKRRTRKNKRTRVRT